PYVECIYDSQTDIEHGPNCGIATGNMTVRVIERILTNVQRLRSLGQSVWIDDLRRDMVASGELAALRAQGVTGITDNPTTFDRAIRESDLYDDDIRRLAPERSPAEILWELLVEDVRQAADVLRSVH